MKQFKVEIILATFTVLMVATVFAAMTHYVRAERQLQRQKIQALERIADSMEVMEFEARLEE